MCWIFINPCLPSCPKCIIDSTDLHSTLALFTKECKTCKNLCSCVLSLPRKITTLCKCIFTPLCRIWCFVRQFFDICISLSPHFPSKHKANSQKNKERRKENFQLWDFNNITLHYVALHNAPHSKHEKLFSFFSFFLFSPSLAFLSFWLWS